MLENFENEKQRDCIGVVGYSYALSSLSKLLKESSREGAGIDLQAGVLLDEVGNPLSSGFKFPLYKNISEMLTAHPRINMVFELSGQKEMVAELRACLPADITLVELPAARFFLRLHATDRLWIACKADLMQTQGLFKSVVDQMPEDIIVIGSSGMIVDCNKPFCTKVGENLEDLRGQNPLHFYDCLSSVCPIEKGVIRLDRMTGDKPDELMMPETDSDGKMNFFRLYIYPIIEGETGKVVQLVVIRRNITERTLMEHRFQQSERMAIVGELSAYVAHEIRNPLMAMGGFAKVLLKNKTIDKAGHEKIEIIYNESKRLDKLLKSILSFVRSKDVEKNNIDVNRVAADAMQLLSLGCQLQGIKVELDLDKNIPLGVGGAEQVRQCLINLVKNSMEAMPDGGTIKISTGVSEAFVWLEVRGRRAWRTGRNPFRGL